MRSKEVDVAINNLKGDAELIVYGNILFEDRTTCKKDDLKTVLAYIEQLEKMIPTPSNPVPVEYQTLILVDKRDAVMKSEIRDKIKELETYKFTSSKQCKKAYEDRIKDLKSIIGE